MIGASNSTVWVLFVVAAVAVATVGTADNLGRTPAIITGNKPAVPAVSGDDKVTGGEELDLIGAASKAGEAET